AGHRLVELRRRVLLARALAGSGERERAEDELRAAAEQAGRIGAVLIGAEADAVGSRIGIALPAVEAEPVAEEREAAPPLGERLVTSLFADVRGYAEAAAAASPERLADDVAALYRFATATITGQGGIVDKFAGDAVMATFN